MSPAVSARALTGLQLAGAAFVLAATAALILWSARVAERAYLIRHDPDAYWITPQQAPHTTARRVDRSDPPAFVFAREFQLAAAPERARIRLRALRDVELRVNGQAVALPGRDPRRWKSPVEADVAELLQPGSNRIEAEVRNSGGPPLLQLRLEGVAERVATGWAWSVESRGQPLRAVVADDVRDPPRGESLPRPFEELRKRAPVGLALFLLAAAPAWLRRPLPRLLRGANAPRVALAAVTAFWGVLFVRKALAHPLELGFDAVGHMDYLRFLAREGRLPLPDEGWSAFHPPLFYAITGGLRAAFGTEEGSTGDRVLLHLLPMLSGLATAWLASRLARALAPGARAVEVASILAAGLLPMQLYVATFVSNEAPHAALVGVALVLAARLLSDERSASRRLLALSGALGLALLTKATSAPLAALILVAVGAKLWLVEARPARALGVVCALAAGALVLAGWFYLRSWQLYGSPFATNVEVFAEWTYWMPPGFHTASWYRGFGEVFVHPVFSSFHSYWDGLYGSFWGDAYASGQAGVSLESAPWDYAAMAAIYPLALPATGILGLGIALCAARALRGPDLGRRLARTLVLALVYLLALMTLLISFRYPVNAYPKAFYGLAAATPLAFLFAEGTVWARDRLAALHRVGPGLLDGYLAVLAFAIAAAFLG